ncbi:gamma-glutamyltransferase [Salicibibacter cibarius]|uniref:Gamma-glutamyltransferase n=1 Tax=Salicibibacter cibarius TaxID=2743000 RepID=A0A7T7CCM2_9BACI|nr:gamma-glutamyltransferase [Salicibibacter cibarius]QQK77059.1 gamma-glutamyltransferase [Salicibibacter cibarius]
MSRNMIVVMSILVILMLITAFLMSENDDNGEEAVNEPPNDETDTDEVQETVEFDGDYGVSTSNDEAQQVGMDVLEEGGNAVDAAIAVSFALGVVEPYGSGIGGGGAMLVLENPEDAPDYYDYRETSPAEGRESEAAVPGYLKGMAHIHEEHGSLPMEDLIEPAREYAANGYEVDSMLANRLEYAGSIEESPDGRIDPGAAEEFYPDGMAIQEGQELVQPRLAETLTHLQEHGLEDFYTGELASEVAGDRSSITEEDLANYEVEEDEPASGSFNGNRVYSSGPPTSGVTFIQMLQMAEQLQLNEQADDGAPFAHLFAEITEQAYSDRLSNIGDPNFSTDMNVDMLTSEEYTQELASEVDTDPVSSEEEEQVAAPEVDDDGNTTHFVVVDEDGHMVSATNTLSNFFGSGQMTDQGFFLNDQMSNFAPEDLPPNDYDSGKRARSFIAPSIFINEEEGIVAGMGSPGGNRIPQLMSQVLINNERLDGDLEEAMNVPRFVYDHQENQILYENEWEDAERLEALMDMGYYTEERVTTVFFGGIQMLEVDYEEGTVEDIPDERR